MARQIRLADSEQTSDEENWFQMKRPSLLKQLQNIMREYPDDVQILYELVQNAEDAKATAMKIMFDSRNIDPGGSYGKYLKSPALCVYNNAVFDEDDWDGIASVYLSHKENIAYKIGRYGQGFKSVFHITGTPTETDVDSEIHTDETGVDELDSRTLHSAREFHVFRLPNPQKQMGWKWFTQAKYDLDAGYATLDGIDLRPFKGYNWICLQCQQATEKAVKAAQYSTDANEVQRSHFFTDNIPNGDQSLSSLCGELSPLVGHINSLRYPDNYSPIPAERYNRDGATKALCLTDKILTYISDKYFM